MKFPEVSLRKDPQILACLIEAKKTLSSDPYKGIIWICEAVEGTKSPVADEIINAIAEALYPFAFFSTWMKEQGIEGDKQALRQAWLDQMILDQIKLPCVKLRRRPEIKAILLEAKDWLCTTYGGKGHLFVCHAVGRACFILDLNDYLEEVQAAICQPLGENTASTFFKSQYADLSDDQCQALRHRWLDQMIGEQP